jgi:hypothetical protein
VLLDPIPAKRVSGGTLDHDARSTTVDQELPGEGASDAGTQIDDGELSCERPRRARVDEGLSAGQADPVRPSGDDGDLAGEVVGHHASSRERRCVAPVRGSWGSGQLR